MTDSERRYKVLQIEKVKSDLDHQKTLIGFRYGAMAFNCANIIVLTNAYSSDPNVALGYWALFNAGLFVGNGIDAILKAISANKTKKELARLKTELETLETVFGYKETQEPKHTLKNSKSL